VIILGISCYFHDAAASVVIDGKIISAAQEERFTRVKNDPRFPIHAINYCLEEANIDEQDIDFVAFYESPLLALDRIAFEISSQAHDIATEQFRKVMKRWPGSKLDVFRSIHENLPGFKGEIFLIEHHFSHAAAAFYPSPYQEAAILTIDGVGEWSTATISQGSCSDIKRISEMHYPNSVGLLYSAATHYLGFKVNSGEYKLMGLAAYGKPRFEDVIKQYLVTTFEDGSIELNMAYFDFSGVSAIIKSTWESLFNLPQRAPEAEINQVHADIASSFQKVVEDIVIKMARQAKELTGASNLCLAGGVALNCVANKKILDDGCFEQIWIQPAAGDAGSSLGAAMALWHGHLKSPRNETSMDLMNGALLGPEYSNEEIIDFLEMYGLQYTRLNDTILADTVADMAVTGKVIGLFQGRMEFGPRALGARSIIADPRSTEMQIKINKSIKFRESFRPFAPVILERECANWFELNCPSPYMLLVAPVVSDKRVSNGTSAETKLFDRLYQPRSPVNAVTHVDYSARVQTVSKNSELPLNNILEAFFEKTGIPVLVNTSFNLRGEPIVCTPLDAYRCMMRSNIDAVVMGNCLVLRDEQPPWPSEEKWDGKFRD